MNYRRLWNTYCCHRYRDKTHFQIVLELLAKLIARPSISTKLMKISLQRHGIQSEIKLAKVLGHRSAGTQAVKRGELFTGRFFIAVRDEELWTVYRSQFGVKVRTVIDDAETICRHEFSLLGSGMTYWGHPIDWHVDPVSGYRWPKRYYFGLKNASKSSKGSDVKLPWELSRMQYFPTLGKVYRLTKDERYAREIVGQISHWLTDNPCPYGINWTCAMDVAIRIMNITWAYLLIEDAPAVTDDFRTRLATSIMQHGQFVLFNLEHSIQRDGSITNGNHYLTNIVGLLHLGLLCPEYPMAETWRRVGLTALVEEMDRQVYPDGGDFESSLSYHRLVLELFIAGALLCRSNGVPLPQRFWDKLERMFEVVLFVTRPDGRVPQVGDADDGRVYILSDYGSWDRTDYRYILSIGAVLFHRGDMKTRVGEFSEEAFWFLGPAGLKTFAALKDAGKDLGSRQFRDSGLYAMRAGSQYLLACCGAVGTAGIGNHKHNDLMSFELFAGDKAFIVDPGAYIYTRYPEWRNLFRSTKYHNTVVIDGQEQNRFEASNLFKMAADSAVIIHEWVSTPERDWLDAEHTGYTRLAQPVSHRRTFLFEKLKGIWTITDLLTSEGQRIADWYLHFDHGIELEPLDEGVFCTQCKGTNLVLAVDAEIPLTFSIMDGWVSRRYGHKLPAKILHMQGTFNSICRVVLTLHTAEVSTIA
jgi:hypothetical protein